MRFEPLKEVRRMARSLRFRLTAYHTAVVLLVAVLSLLAVREGVRRTLLAEVDELLREDVLEIRLAIRQLYPNMERVERMLERKAQGHVEHRWFAQVFDAEGRLQWASPDAPDEPFAAQPAERAGLATAPPYRLVHAVVQEPGVPRLSLRVGASQESVDSAVGHMTRMMVAAALTVLLIGPLGGYWLAGRATRPLARIIHTTARLHPSQLDERLPIRQTGDELDQLSHTINGMLDRIASYLTQNRDFIANAAHELRSPLAAMRSALEVALDRERSAEETKALLEDVLEECVALGNLVTRLLVLAAGDAGRLASPDHPGTRLDVVVARALDMFQFVAESQGVALGSTGLEHVTVPGDESHLRQVVQNLIENAVKFTPAGGSVNVGLRLEPGQARAELTVHDTGQGIAPEDLPRIFERFYRVDKSRRHGDGPRGHGLGLSICQAIVTALGGDIAATSTPGAGTTLTVHLPVRGVKDVGAKADGTAGDGKAGQVDKMTDVA